MLKNPLLIRSTINVLEEMMGNGTLDISDEDEQKQCLILTGDLKQLYRETLKVHTSINKERNERS